MNLKITLNGKTFAVTVGDLAARPIVAVVEGERFEVWPEAAPPPSAAPVASPLPPASAPVAPPAAAAPSAPSAAVVLAPLPGVIVGIAAQPGQTVAVGQALCTIEAMKMKNVIRANRVGTVKVVHITPGQTVKQRQLLLEYEAGENAPPPAA